MRRDVRAAIVTLACTSAIGAAVGPTLSGARNLSLLFATPLTTGGAVRSAIDARGFIYLAGNVAEGTLISARSAFVTKLTPSGTPLYTTYFQAARFSGEYNDCGIEIHALAVDRNGDAYVAGCTSAEDFPVVRPLVATLPNARGSAFVAKLDPAGAIVYSTYFRAYNATAIAADDDGNTYLVGPFADRLPLVNPALTDGPGFVAKLDSSGAHILYSTYVDASVRAITVDRSGAAFLAGAGEAFVSPTGRPPRCLDRSGDAVVIKLASSGSRYDYAVCLGGSGSEDATGIAIDSSGAEYVVGTTSSVDFPTARPLDLPLHTGALWKTDDAGHTWTNLPLAESSVNQIVATGAQPPTWFANGSFRSLDQGRTWQRLGQTFFRVVPDPRSPRTLYGTTFDGAVFKSLDGGEQWTATGAPVPGIRPIWPLIVDPRDSRVLYAANGRVWRSGDGGATWTQRDNGLGAKPIVDGLAVDPAAGVLFANSFNNENLLAFFNRLFTSVDSGVTWTPTSLSLESRLFSSLLVLPRRRGLAPPRSRPPDRVPPPDEPTTTGPSTIYVAARQFFDVGPLGVLARSDDGGATWTAVGAGLPTPGVDVIAGAQRDDSLIYAGSGEGLFVSRDHGDTFERVATPWPGLISALAIDPRDSRIVFVGSAARAEGFVAKIAPGGGGLEYATYLGGAGTDAPDGVAVDELGRAIVFGATDSNDFPSVLPLQLRGGGIDGFVSVLDGGGSVLLSSTWIGGRGDDRIASLALRGGQMIIGGGSTDVASLFPGANVTAGGFVGVLDLSYGALGRSHAIAGGHR